MPTSSTTMPEANGMVASSDLRKCISVAGSFRGQGIQRVASVCSLCMPLHISWWCCLISMLEVSPYLQINSLHISNISNSILLLRTRLESQLTNQDLCGECQRASPSCSCMFGHATPVLSFIFCFRLVLPVATWAWNSLEARSFQVRVSNFCLSFHIISFYFCKLVRYLACLLHQVAVRSGGKLATRCQGQHPLGCESVTSKRVVDGLYTPQSPENGGSVLQCSLTSSNFEYCIKHEKYITYIYIYTVNIKMPKWILMVQRVVVVDVGCWSFFLGCTRGVR